MACHCGIFLGLRRNATARAPTPAQRRVAKRADNIIDAGLSVSTRGTLSPEPETGWVLDEGERGKPGEHTHIFSKFWTNKFLALICILK